MAKRAKLFDFSTLRFYYNHIGYRLYVQIAFSVLISLLDSLGLGMFFPLFDLVSSETGAETKGESKVLDITRKVFDFLGLEVNLVNVLLILITFFILKGIAQYLYIIYDTNVRQAFIRNLRLELIDDIKSFSYTSFVKSDIGRIQNVLTGEIVRVAAGYVSYFSMIQNIIFVIIYMLVVFAIDFQFAIFVAIGGLLTNLIFNRIFKYTKNESRELTKKNNSFQGLVIQFIGNFKYLKATGKVEPYSEILEKDVYRLEKNSRMIGKLSGIVTAIREPMLIIIIGIVIIIEIKYFNGSIAAILVSLLFFYRALGYLMVVQNLYNSYLAVSGSLENVTGMSAHLKEQRETFSNESVIQSLNNEIEIRDAGFAYDNGMPVLIDINLRIKKNQTIALVGESGSGKTTLANVIAGLFKLDSGELLIDNTPIESLKIDQYRNMIGYITQEAVIFNDSIFNNVTFWAKPEEESRKKFREAIVKASIDEFIDELPEKEQTLLGNNGINLSGGQRQRISIARELYKDAKILILDEATSALDSETEREVQANIDRIKGHYTIIIIAHRLSTVKNADKIVLMDKGRINDVGTFSELYRNSAKFKKMVDQQDFSDRLGEN